MIEESSIKTEKPLIFLPPLSILVRGRKFYHFYEIEIEDGRDSCSPSLKESSLMLPDVESGSLSSIIGSVNSMSPLYSPKGDILAIVEGGPKSIISFVQTVNQKQISQIHLSDLGTDPIFSPKGNFFITWSQYRRIESSGSSTSTPSNLKVWKIPPSNEEENCLECEIMVSFSMKVFRSDILLFSSDERFLFHLVTNEVHIFDLQSTLTSQKPIKLAHRGISQFQITSTFIDITSTSLSYINIAVFVPEISGKPASATIYRFTYPSSSSSSSSSSSVESEESFLNRMGSRSMFAASEVKLLWNSKGDTLLAHTHSDVDRSNASYYGSSNLFYIKIEGGSGGITCKDGLVPTTKEGPVHDVQWCPLGDKFIVCAGNMPSQSTLFDDKISPLFEFGSAHRNTISWSPHGRFVCLAGFGNLAGEMDFYDALRLRKLGSNVAHATGSYSWSPDSRYFLSATVSPRMNVDNGWKIFKYNGIGPILSKSFDVIYDVIWQPAEPGIYPSRGPSPKRESIGVNSVSSNTTIKSASSSSSTTTTIAYRPPAYRAPGTSSAFSDLLKRDSGPVGKVKNSNTSNISSTNTPTSSQSSKPQRTIPGMAVVTSLPTPPISSNSKTNSKVKATSTTNTKIKGKEEIHPTVATETKMMVTSMIMVPTSSAAIEEPSSSSSSSLSMEDTEKRIKVLKKKLKQIDEIKIKQSQDPSSLNNDQKAKLESESALLEELQALSIK